MTESAIIRHEPCPHCGSRDNLGRYDDGHGYCFGCGAYEAGEGEEAEKTGASKALHRGSYAPLLKRCLSEETLRKFDYRLDPPFHYATYYDAKGRPVAQKRRSADKKFVWVGDSKKAVLFGQQCWKGGGRKVVVTEGELDAMSMSQVQGNKWPVVSVKDGAGSAARSIRENIEWISSFDEVVLMFDNDEPGRDAAQICAELLPPGKASIATLPLKDANEMLVARRGHELISAMWQAKPYRPDGIVEGTELWDRLQVADPVTEAEYPFFRLNANLRGLRRGELVTFCAGTGVGKSTVCRETAFSLIQSGEQVGYIALEESVKRTATALMSLHLNRPLHLDPMAPDDPEFKGAFEATVGSGRIAFYDHWGSVDSETLLSKIRFMAVGLGCRWVFLDHISIMVSGIDSNDSERILLDRAMTHLASLAREVNIGLIVVCHLSKSKEKGKSFEEGARPTLGDLRGTAGISQLSDSVVAFARDQQDPDDRVVQVFILKSRFTGFTGPSGELVWNGKTGRLQDEEGTRFTSDDDDGGGDENLGSEDGSEAGSEF